MEDVKQIIMVAEYEAALLQALVEKLSDFGYGTVEATDGEEACRIALEKHPDLIVLDIFMPKMDGMSIMKKLREDDWGKNVPIIILTNVMPNDDILQSVTRDHPAYYLIKSESKLEEIIDKIKEVLATKTS